MSNNKKKRKLNKWRLSLVIGLLLFFIVGGAGLGFLIGVIKNMPDFDPENYNPDLTTSVYDSEGNLISHLRGSENRMYANFDEIPDTVKEAFLAVEDHRFYNHFGVDIESVARSVVANIRHGGYAQGFSTITMQLARNAFIESREKRLERKIQEIILSIQLERIYTKDEIFEFYLNHIYFGEGAWGIKAAAQIYFDKELDELTLAESAMLAGVVQRPSTHSPFTNPDRAMNRRNTVLNLMAQHGFISEAQAEEAKKEEFVLNEDRKRLEENNPWFIDYVIKEASNILEDLGMEASQLFKSGFAIYTSMDPTIQKKLEQVYSDPNNFPKSVDEVLVESAAIFIDHNTGEIKALVGGRELTTRRGLNRATDIKRQPGSTIKPLVAYGPALEMGYSPGYVLDDAPVDFPSSPKPYSPNNHDRRFRGLITMRHALKDSVNIPAVKMLQEIGVSNGFEFGKKLGLPLLESDKNLSLALGGLTEGVSPLNIASAFGAFANQGVLIEPHAITKILDKDGQVLYEANPSKNVVMSEQTAYLITDMLMTVTKSGTGTRARLNRPTAGKTGTTQLPPLPEYANLPGSNFRDSWFVGYTPEYTGAVWMGYDNTTPTHYLRQVYGGQMPALIWKQVMEVAVKDKPVTDFPRPSNLVYTAIDAKSGLLPSELTPSQYIVNEIFVRDHVPKQISNAWVEKPICSETGKRPSEYCPDIVNGVFLQRSEPYQPPASRPNSYPEDYSLEYPREVCDIHGPGTSMTVYLCEDERHRGVPYLALRPGPGEEGGCPEHVVTQRRMSPGNLPTEYCNIEEHQLFTPSGQNNGSIDLDPIETEETPLKLNLELHFDGNSYGVLLNWNSIGTNISYSIQRWENGELRKQLGSTTGTTFLDESVEPNKTYRYQIIAGNRSSNRAEIKVK